MSQAKQIYDLIQEIRDAMKTRWADHGDMYLMKVERDKQCKEIQSELRKRFPDELARIKGAE